MTPLNKQARLAGKWVTGAGLPGFYGVGYSYATPKDNATARYEFKIAKSGRYEVRMNYSPHENRATKAPVTIESAEGTRTATVNETIDPPIAPGFVSVGTFRFESGKPAAVTLSSAGADGNVHADVVQLVPVP